MWGIWLLPLHSSDIIKTTGLQHCEARNYWGTDGLQQIHINFLCTYETTPPWTQRLPSSSLPSFCHELTNTHTYAHTHTHTHTHSHTLLFHRHFAEAKGNSPTNSTFFLSHFPLNAQMRHLPFTHHLQFWLPLPCLLCFEDPSSPPPSLLTLPPQLQSTSVGAKQSQQWLDPGTYERSSLISLGQEQHKGSNQRHKLN